VVNENNLKLLRNDTSTLHTLYGYAIELNVCLSVLQQSVAVSVISQLRHTADT